MYTKYPRTMHLPSSQGVQSDDKVISTLEHLYGHKVVITEKMDGENTTMYTDHIHARSIDSRHHESRDWVKSFWGDICFYIPKGWRICGENLYATHSIEYTKLKSYFYGFSIWDENNTALSWYDTLEWFEELGIIPAPTIYTGVCDEDVINAVIKGTDTSTKEGFVVRTMDEIRYEDFSTKVAKWVRKGHVQTDKHWMASAIVPNQLLSGG